MIDVYKKLEDTEIDIVSKNNQYRLCVAGVIEYNGKIFCGSRVDNLDTTYKNCVGMPQGGMELSESIIEAVYREIYEETGIKYDNLTLKNYSNSWYYYDVPSMFLSRMNGRKGQVQRWFHFELLSDKSINLNLFEQEFSSYSFETAEYILEHCVDFKKDVYMDVFKEFNVF